MSKTFTHEVQEARQNIERTEHWSAEIEGYDVGVTRRDNGFTEVYVSPISYERPRLPLVKFYPKSVEDIERVIARLPNLLRAAVVELCAAGLDDLRSQSDVQMDKMRSLWPSTPPPPPTDTDTGRAMREWRWPWSRG